jgi:outer membrane protein W
MIASHNAWAAPSSRSKPQHRTTHVAQSSSNEGLGFRSLGANIGFVDADNVPGTMGMGVFANLGNITSDIRLVPVANYWSKSEEFAGDKVSVRDISFGARGQYMFRVNSPKFQPYMGAGLGMHFVRAEVSSVSQPMSVSASDTKLGVDMGGGFSTPLGHKTDLNFDLWYTAASDVAHISMKAGISFDL